MKIRRILLSFLLLSVAGASQGAEPIMSKSEYENYSVKYRCIEIQHVQDIEAKEAAMASLEAQYKLNDDNFEAFDELIGTYEKDNALLDRIRERVQKECPQQ